MKYKKEQIIDSIVKMALDKGASTKTIINDFLMGQLGYAQSYSYDLHREAMVEIRRLHNVKNLHLADMALGKLERLYQDAIEEKNKKLALEILKEINKLTGSYAADKIDLNVTELKAKFPGFGDKKEGDDEK